MTAISKQDILWLQRNTAYSELNQYFCDDLTRLIIRYNENEIITRQEFYLDNEFKNRLQFVTRSRSTNSGRFKIRRIHPAYTMIVNGQHSFGQPKGMWMYYFYIKFADKKVLIKRWWNKRYIKCFLNGKSVPDVKFSHTYYFETHRDDGERTVTYSCLKLSKELLFDNL